MLSGLVQRFRRPLDATAFSPFAWMLCALLAAACAATVRLFGFTVLIPPWLIACVVATAVILVLLRDSDLARRLPRLVFGCTVFIVLGLQSLAAIVLSYAVLATNLPLQDGALQALDQALGFDWLAFRHTVLGLPVLDGLLFQAYASLGIQFAVVPLVLLLAGQGRRIEVFLCAVIVCELVACLVSAVWPCMGGASLDGFAAVAQAAPGATHLGHYLPLRDGSLRIIDPADVYGLVSLPSFHCAGAYLAVAALWPLRWTRLPMLALNGLMTLSSVTHGAHYLADCAAGLALAALAFHGCRRAVAWSATRAEAPRRHRPATAGAAA